MIAVVSYTIYHSPNAYLGSILAERALAGLPVSIERRPICIPKDRGVKVADLVGSKETAAKGSPVPLQDLPVLQERGLLRITRSTGVHAVEYLRANRQRVSGSVQAVCVSVERH